MNEKVSSFVSIKNWDKAILIIFVALKFLFMPCFGFAMERRIKLRVYFKEAQVNDTLLLNITHRYFTTGDKATFYSSKKDNGAFLFDVPVNYATGFWELRKLEYNSAPNKRSLPQLVRQYFWEAGDDITLFVSSNLKGNLIKSSCKFLGTGSTKYNLMFMADSVYWNSTEFAKLNRDPDEQFSTKNRSLMKLTSDFIDNDKNDITELARYITKTELFLEQGSSIALIIERYVKKNNLPIGSVEREKLLEKVHYIFSGNGVLPIDSTKIYLSGRAISFFWQGIKTESVLKFDRADTKWMYDQIIHRYTGELRDQILAFWLQYKRIDGELSETLYRKALATIKSVDALSQIKSVEHFYVKKYIKNYLLTNEKGEMVSFNEFKNKIIFVDFWFTGCAACASLYEKVVSKVEHRYANDREVLFISISTDRFRNKWLEGLKSGLYSSGHGINLYTNGQGNKHPIITDNKVSYQPVTMLIDKAGVIRYFNTDNLYEEGGLIKAIEELK